LFSGCGMALPTPVYSSSNVIFITLSLGIGQLEGTRFKLRWYELPATVAATRNATASGEGGGQRMVIPANETVTIRNPGYPRYANDVDLRWILEGPPGMRLQLSIR